MIMDVVCCFMVSKHLGVTFSNVFLHPQEPKKQIKVGMLTGNCVAPRAGALQTCTKSHGSHAKTMILVNATGTSLPPHGPLAFSPADLPGLAGADADLRVWLLTESV